MGVKARVKEKDKKEQSAMEFMSTYGWAFLLLAVMIIALYYFITIPSQVSPQRCSFAYAITCEWVNVGTNTLGTVAQLYLVNGQPYDLIGNIIATATISQAGTANTVCSTSNVLQGGVILCNIMMPSKIKAGKNIVGTLLINTSVCISGPISSCEATQPVSYIGNFTSYVTGNTRPIPVSIQLYESGSSIPPSTQSNTTLNAYVDIFGQPARSASVFYNVLAVAPPSATTQNTISPPYELTDPSGNASATLSTIATSTPGIMAISATFAGQIATNVISIGQSSPVQLACSNSVHLSAGEVGVSGIACSGYTVTAGAGSTYVNYGGSCPSQINMGDGSTYLDLVVGCNPSPLNQGTGSYCYNINGVNGAC